MRPVCVCVSVPCCAGCSRAERQNCLRSYPLYVCVNVDKANILKRNLSQGPSAHKRTFLLFAGSRRNLNSGQPDAHPRVPRRAKGDAANQAIHSQSNYIYSPRQNESVPGPISVCSQCKRGSVQPVATCNATYYTYILI